MSVSLLGLRNGISGRTQFTLAQTLQNGVVYKDISRPISNPNSVSITSVIGNPGAKGNDRVAIVVRDTITDTLGAVVTGSVRCELSIPRNAEFTVQKASALLWEVVQLLGETSNVAAIVAGAGPTVNPELGSDIYPGKPAA